MADLAASRTRTSPMMGAHGAGVGKPYPGLVVVLSILAFCLSFWAAVIFAAVHYG
jgi:hypothetical protein